MILPVPEATEEAVLPSPEPVPSEEPAIPLPEDVPSPTPDSIPITHNEKLYILMYHSVVQDGTDCNNWTITTSRLREDLQWLSDNGYTTVLPRELAAGSPLPEKAVMLTFDDGYADNYDLLFPLLREYNAKAVISLVTKWVDDEYATYFLNWDQCREMHASGLVEFGSHSHDLHENGIIALDSETEEDYAARVLPDLQNSIDLIEANLGVKPCFFAYPHGRIEALANDFVHSNFSMTVSTLAAPADISNGLYALPRYNITVNYTAAYFIGK